MLAKHTDNATDPVIINPDAFATSLRKRSYWLRRIERKEAQLRRKNGLRPTRWYKRGTFTRNVQMCHDCLDGIHGEHARPCSCICRGEWAPLLRHEQRA